MASVILRRAFNNSYRYFVAADDIVEKIHGCLLTNKDTLMKIYPKHVYRNLIKIHAQKITSKKYIIAFMKAMANYHNHVIYCKRKTEYRLEDGIKKRYSCSYYCLLKL